MLGADLGVRCVTIIGRVDTVEQAIALAKRPHIIFASPGRLLDHISNTKGFSLQNLQHLVLDEADRLLDLDFGPSIDVILKHVPIERRTYLFSATMTTKVAKLQRASLVNPVRLEVKAKYASVSILQENFIFTPLTLKDAHLVWLLYEQAHSSTIIFTRTTAETERLSLLLRALSMSAIPYSGALSQSMRQGALNKFRSGTRTILVATYIAGRGLDIPLVDLVVHFDLPHNSKEYVHRVGRTAQAGRTGLAIAFITHYDVELVMRIEDAIGKKMEKYAVNKQAVQLLRKRVAEAQRIVARQMQDGQRVVSDGAGSRNRKQESRRDMMDKDDDQHEARMPVARKKYKGRK